MSFEAIKIGIVGLGHIGKRHLANVLANPNCELAATCDPADSDFESLKNFRSLVPHFKDLETMLRQTDFDVLAVCTPNGLHAKNAIAGIRAGRHVLVEKPMALHKTDCESIVYEALQHDRKVFVVMQNRYSPAAKWLKQVVSEGFLGQIFLIEINCYWNRDDRYYNPGGEKHAWRGSRNLDGGPVFTQFSHFIDLLFWVFGDLKTTAVRQHNFAHQHSTDFADTGIVLFETPGGATGIFSYTTAVWQSNLENSVTVVGSRGSVKMSGQYFEKIETANFERLSECPPPEISENQNSENHAAVLQNVVEVLRGKSSVGTNALEGLKVVAFIEGLGSQIFQE